MSCIANFQTGTFSGKRPSASYYNITSLAGQMAGNALYESTLSSSFKDFLGFDWTQQRRIAEPALNQLGEPSTNFIMNYLGINRSPEVAHGIEQIETLFTDGYLGKSFVVESPLRMKLNEIHLNPRFRHVSAEIFSTGKRFWLKARTNPNKPESKIDRDFLRLAKFLPQLQDLVDEYGYSDLFSVLGSMDTMGLTSNQAHVLSRFRELSLNNPSVKLVIFDRSDVDYDRSFYDPRTNTVYIAKDFTTPQSQAKFVQDVLHELAHVYTLGALTNPRTLEEYQFRDKMTKIYEDFLDTFPLVTSAYGFTNVEEFVAEFLSNPKFRLLVEELEEQTREKKNWFQNLLDTVRNFLNKMFGYSSTSPVKVGEIIDEYLDYIGGNNDIPLVPGEMHLRFNSPISDEQRTETRSQVAELAKTLSRKNINYRTLNTRVPNNFKEELNQLALTGTPEEIFSKVSEYLTLMKKSSEVFKSQKFQEQTIATLEKLKTGDAAKQIHELMKVFDMLEENTNHIRTTLDSMDKSVLADMFSDIFFDTASTRGLFSSFLGYTLDKTFSQNLTNLIEKIKEIESSLDTSRKAIFTKSQDIVFRELLEALDDETLDNTKEEVQRALDVRKEWKERSKSNRYDNQIKNLQELVTALGNRNSFVQYVKDNLHERRGRWDAVNSILSSSQNGAPIAQLIKNYIDTQKYQAFNKRLEYGQRLSDIRQRLSKYHTKHNFFTTLKGKNYTQAFYKDIVKSVSVSYLDFTTGEITSVQKLVLNTQQDYVQFQNDYLEYQSKLIQLENELQQLTINQEDSADIQAKQAEIEAAEIAMENFLRANAETEFVEDYYKIEDALDKDENGNLDEIGKQARERLDTLRDQLKTASSLVESSAFFDSMDAALDADVKRLQQEIKELRNPYDRNGNKKTDIDASGNVTNDYSIAMRLQRYFKARREAQVTISSMSELGRARFQSQKEILENKVKVAKSIYNSYPSPENLQNLTAAEEEYKKWLSYNTRVEISPEFYELEVRPILENIKRLSNNPKISEIMDEMNAIILGKKDEDNVIVGHEFSDGEIDRINALEKELEALRKADKLARDKATKLALANEFKKLQQIQTKQTTAYYDVVLYENKSRIRDIVETREEQEIRDQAERVYEILGEIYNNGTVAATEEDKKLYFFTEGIIVDEYTDDMDIFFARNPKEAVAIIYEAILNRKILEEQVKDKWFRANHTLSYLEEERQTAISGRRPIAIPVFSPIRIWYENIPTDSKYINTEAPSMRWYDHQVNPAYMNPRYKYGKPTPKQGLYQNPNYPSDPELAGIIEDYQNMLDELNELMPKSHQIQNYLLPSQNKGINEITNSTLERPIKAGKGLFTLLKSIKDELYEDPEYLYEETFANAKNLRSKPTRIRFKEPIPEELQSHDVADMFLKFMDHAVTTEAMVNASPAVLSAYESLEGKDNLGYTKDRVEFDIYRNLYGANPLDDTSRAINENLLYKLPLRAFRRLVGFTSKRVLNWALMRFVKNFVSQMAKQFLRRGSYKLNAYQLLKSHLKMWTMMRTHLHLQRGGDDMQRKAALFIMLNSIPSSDNAHQASLGKRTFRNKFISPSILPDITTNASEFLSGGSIGQALLDQTYVEMNGQQVKLEEALYFDGYTLNFKSGVYGYNKQRIERAEQRLEAARAQYIQTNNLPPNPVGTELVKMNKALAPLQKRLDEIAQEEEAKLKPAWKKINTLRNRIHNYYYDSNGAYHERSYIRAKNNVIFSTIMMLKDRWMIPHVQTYFGGPKPVFYSGRYQEGIYSHLASGFWSRMLALKKGNLGGAFSRSKVSGNVFSKFLIEDTVISLTARLINLYVTKIAIENLWWAGTALYQVLKQVSDDDDEEKKRDFTEEEKEERAKRKAQQLKQIAELKKKKEKEQSNIIGILALITNGIDDEVTTMTNPIIMGADLYTKYVKYPPYVVSKESEGVWKFAKLGLFALIDNNARSLSNTVEAFMMIPETLRNPMKPYYEYADGIYGKGIIAKKNTKKIIKGQPQILANWLMLNGGVSVNSWIDSKYNLEMMLRYNSRSSLGLGNIGLGDNPMAEYTRVMYDMNVVKRTALNYVMEKMPKNEGNLAFEEKPSQLLGQDSKFKEYLQEYGTLKNRSNMLEFTYPILAEAKVLNSAATTVNAKFSDDFDRMVNRLVPGYNTLESMSELHGKRLRKDLGIKKLAESWEKTIKIADSTTKAQIKLEKKKGK